MSRTSTALKPHPKPQAIAQNAVAIVAETVEGAVGGPAVAEAADGIVVEMADAVAEADTAVVAAEDVRYFVSLIKAASGSRPFLLCRTLQ
jgi:hypothetical protein